MFNKAYLFLNSNLSISVDDFELFGFNRFYDFQSIGCGNVKIERLMDVEVLGRFIC
jgi:hypothetical protein